MQSQDYPITRKTEIVIQELRGETLIYDLRINKAYCLNETAARIYQLCDGKHSITEIGREIAKQLKQPVTEDIIWLAIDQLKQEDLLETSHQNPVIPNGLSRRDAIRKAGIASMVVLPVISSLVAPTAAMAQSGGGGGGLALRAACTTTSQCAQGTCGRPGGVGQGYCCTGSPSSVGFEGIGVSLCNGNIDPDCEQTCRNIARTECCDGRGESQLIFPNQYSCICSV